MSRSRFVPLLNSILPSFPGFAAKGRMLFAAPIETILQGICFEPSAFDRVSFTIETFVMPLSVPSDHIYFSFGASLFRPGRGYGWTSEMPDLTSELIEALQQYALPFLSRRTSLADFIDATPIANDWYTLQAIGYCQARIGRIGDSIDTLERLLAKGTGERAWEIALVDRIRAFRTKLIGDPSAAQQQLIAWEKETVENLGLTKFRTG